MRNNGEGAPQNSFGPRGPQQYKVQLENAQVSSFANRRQPHSGGVTNNRRRGAASSFGQRQPQNYKVQLENAQVSSFSNRRQRRNIATDKPPDVVPDKPVEKTTADEKVAE